MSRGGSQRSAPMRDGRPGRGAVIVDDMRCPGCGYNLRGLNAGTPCPECGRDSTGRRTRVDDSTLGDAPTAYVATLGVALFVAAFAGVINFFNAVPLTFMMNGGSVSLFFGGVHVVAAAVWVGAIMITFRARPRAPDADPDTAVRPVEWLLLRRAGVATQLVWPAVALLRCAQFGMDSAVAGWFAHGLAIVGGAGWAIVALHTSFLADWARDDGAAGRLRAGAWGLAFLGLGVLGIVHVGTLEYGWTNLIFLFSGVIVFGWVASYVMLIQGATQLGFAAHWAIVNAHESAERDRRMAERTRRAAEERLAQEKNWDPPFQADPSVLSSFEASQASPVHEAPAGPAPGASMPSVPRPEGIEPYRVEEGP